MGRSISIGMMPSSLNWLFISFRIIRQEWCRQEDFVLIKCIIYLKFLLLFYLIFMIIK